MIPLLILTLLSSWLVTTESGLHWIFARASHYFPGDISAQSLQGSLSGPVHVTNLEISHEGNRYSSQSLHIDWDLWKILAGNLHVKQLKIAGLNIQLQQESSTNLPADTAITLPDIQLPFRLIVNAFQLDRLNFQQGDKLISLDEVSSQLTILLSQLNIKSLSLKQADAKLNINGRIALRHHYKHKLNIDWQLVHNQLIYSGNGKVEGNLKSTQIQHTSGGAIKSELSLTARELMDKLSWEAKAQVVDIRSADFLQQYPDTTARINLTASGNQHQAAISGQLLASNLVLGDIDADFDTLLSPQKLTLNRLNLKASKLRTQFVTHGEIDQPAKPGNIKLYSEWTNLHIPVDNTHAVSSSQGKITIDGTLKNYSIDLDSQLTVHLDTQSVETQLHAAATGTLHTLNINRLQLAALEGNTILSGSIDWKDSVKWQASINASQINPGVLDKNWPGRIAASFNINGTHQHSQLNNHIMIKRFDGTLRDLPVSMQGELSWNQLIAFNQFHLLSNQSSIRLDGQLDLSGANTQLTWLVDSSSLEDFHPELTGKLKSQGEINGTINSPRIEAEINASNITYTDYALQTLSARLHLDLEKQENNQSRIEASNILFGGQQINSLVLQQQNDRLSIDASHDRFELSTTSTLNRLKKNWQGQIQTLQLSSADYGNWALTAAVAYSISPQQIAIEKGCLKADQQQQLCVELGQQQSLWSADIDGSELPLDVISAFIPVELSIRGVASLRSRLSFTDPQQLSGHLDLNLSSGSIIFPLPEDKVYEWKYHSGELISTIDADGIQSVLKLDLVNSDKLISHINLPNATFPLQPSQAVVGNLELSLTDFTPVELLIPEVRSVKGKIASSIRLTGKLSNPVLKGYFDLSDGTLYIPALGITLDQVRIHAEDIKPGLVELKLSARSGEGMIDILSQTQLSAENGWPTQITMKGQNFEVIHISDAKVHIDPNIKIQIQKRNIRINGDMHIPYAKLQPKDISTADRVSSDAVIIGRDEIVEKWLSHTSLRLTLGDRVSLYGYGFEGRLEGNLLLEDSPGQPPRGTGEISIPEGRYRAYGQRLDIEQGRLVFAGGPLVNPGLDFRAVRKVNQVTSGLKVRGTLHDPVLELFSEPVMGQTNALSYLLLGRPIESASGDEGNMMAKAALAMGLSGGDTIARNLGERFGFDDFRIDSNGNGDYASLVIGRYLSPRLYVSYGVGLIDSINTLFLRYEISEQWQIKAESGDNQGADIQYTFER